MKFMKDVMIEVVTRASREKVEKIEKENDLIQEYIKIRKNIQHDLDSLMNMTDDVKTIVLNHLLDLACKFIIRSEDIEENIKQLEDIVAQLEGIQKFVNTYKV